MAWQSMLMHGNRLVSTYIWSLSLLIFPLSYAYMFSALLLGVILGKGIWILTWLIHHWVIFQNFSSHSTRQRVGSASKLAGDLVGKMMYKELRKYVEWGNRSRITKGGSSSGCILWMLRECSAVGQEPWKCIAIFIAVTLLQHPVTSGIYRKC